ncbi:hypothetical protein AWC04_05210 [Mycolicibacterium fallax]|uniref:Uncharacterized protein n=2 Tax=Mycolicibacterium fallax TaxID=1793 RepID=A0A1X1RIK9_MYCFA|nr:hypothetical protein [Mycolicibacterium fallax]ORV06836.1 hypothetical protein AWC04_05210 [Mycolicibacterium fallax]BBY96818.1 hypothetical protein MFAL_02850 [Mycolicibacterium fallax]HSA40864.1 hypothetical protein [Mycobacterium sp.]
MTSGPDDPQSREPRTHQVGGMRWQEPGVSVPRPPTLAEARARERALRAQEAAEAFAAEQRATAEARKAGQKKVLMGTVAVVGLVGAVALGYQLLNNSDARTVQATCVRDGSDEVVPDSYCASGHSTGGGLFIFAGAPYRYYYGGSNQGIGSRATGGTLTVPSGAVAKTKSGATVSRGGFGVGSKSSGS